DGIRRLFLLIRDVFAGVFLPLTFFPVLFQKILFFMPFQYITYVPIRVFMGSYSLGNITLSIPEIVGLQAISVIVMYLVSEVMWRAGIKQFTGVGV
nr:ABC-2 family transporter protein [Vallitaleaceae bacterium]